MCSNHDLVENTKWQQKLPDSPGEWLWVSTWSCGCVDKAGIAWVFDGDIDDNSNSLQLPDNLYLSWEGQHGKQDLRSIVAWQKISLPPLEWCDK